MAANETLIILNLWQFVFNSVSGLIIINVCPDTERYSVTALQLKKYAIPVLGGVAFIFAVNKLTIVWNIDAYWEKCIHWVTIFSAQGNNSFAISIYLCIFALGND